ncbi:MAG: DsbA family protein [Saprospirales bacterium]|nr:MAG: DsbA family protein [Saprospirales bacterium]
MGKSALFSLILVFGLGNSALSQEERLYYIFDPLCGWCFGFSDEMAKVAERYGDQMEIRVLSGGMVTGDRVGPIGETSAYIKEAYKTVEEATGVEFGQAFLDHLFKDGSQIFSSLEPSIALVVMKELAPEYALDFAADLHRAIYVDGLPTTSFESYASYAVNYGLDRNEFLRKCRDPEMKRKAEVEFTLAANLGATGFPTLVYYNGRDLQVVSRGFMKAGQIAARIDALR